MRGGRVPWMQNQLGGFGHKTSTGEEFLLMCLVVVVRSTEHGLAGHGAVLGPPNNGNYLEKLELILIIFG